MKVVVVVLLVVALIAIYWFSSKKQHGSVQSTLPSSENENPYYGLRELALQADPTQVSNGQTDPYGVIMDCDVQGRTATVVAFADGSSSLYTSIGGGILGGGGPAGRNAAQAAVRMSSLILDRATQAETAKLPSPGEVLFHVLTKQGVRTARAQLSTLGGSEPMTALFDTMQVVLNRLEEAADTRSRTESSKN